MALPGLLGRKIGMTQVFRPDGTVEPVTVIQAGPNVVTQLRTVEKDGYEAVQVGFGDKKRLNKPERGHLGNRGNLRHLREFRGPVEGVSVGDHIGPEILEPGMLVDVTARSKGRGFAGVVKRHGFHGGPKTHGQSDRHRAPGSIGSGTTPGRVFKGLKMAGHMGAENVTVRALEVLEVDPARGLLLVKGSIPGARNGLVRVRRSTKQRR
ncbi:MAG TPA: 50S ribosomal protein L3 [Dehalococcoidia bacterium]|nr:50S ribosomal protein L3 [Dehalococcoidia bacterium]